MTTLTNESFGASLLQSCWKQSEAFAKAVLVFADRDSATVQSMESTILHLWALAYTLDRQYPSAVEEMRLQYVAILNSFVPDVDESRYQRRCAKTDSTVLERFREYKSLVRDVSGILDFHALGRMVAANLFEDGSLDPERELEFGRYLHAYLTGWLLQVLEYLDGNVRLV